MAVCRVTYFTSFAYLLRIETTVSTKTQGRYEPIQITVNSNQMEGTKPSITTVIPLST